MDWSSNLIQIRLFIQFKPLKDTFSNPSLKARIVQLACQWCEWVQIEGLLFSLFPPRGSLWQGRTPGDRLSVQGMESTQHTCPHCHLSWEQPFKSVHFYILPLPQYSDLILTTVAYIILNWMKIEKQPSTRLVPPPALMLSSWLSIKPPETWDDQLTFHISTNQPTIGCSEKFTLEILRILFWFCKIFRKCRVQCW